MHLRIATVRSGNQVYRYHQIVESYRNDKGRPAHRVLASFRELPALLAENLRTALAASRQGRATIVDDAVRDLSAIRVVASQPYLGLAVLWTLGERLGLWQFLESVGLDRQGEVLASSIALVLHRIAQPESKLAATRWYPTTVLPQWLGLPAEQFNNSRVHRVLSRLDEVAGAVQEKMAPFVERQSGAVVVMFNDITQVVFEGDGPTLASDRRCRDGALRRVVGVALLTDDQGRPLRWRTLAGNYGDGNELVRLAIEVAGSPWAQGRPLVMDRSVGIAERVEALLDAKVRLVTAVPSTEMPSYTRIVGSESFAKLELGLTQQTRVADLTLLRRAAERAGFIRVSDERWVRDLGVIERPSTRPNDTDGGVADTLRLALTLKAQGRRRAQDGGGAPEISPRTARRYRTLAKLALAVQARILNGEARNLVLSDVYKLAATPQAEQSACFEELLAKRAPQRARPGRRRHLQSDGGDKRVQVRGVLYFNPEHFLDARAAALAQDAELREELARLNASLASRKSRRTLESAIGALSMKIRKRSVSDVYSVKSEAKPEASHPALSLVRSEDAWERRRRFDGCYLVISHPEISRTAPQLVDLYFSKDQVEKNFQTIKSQLEIQPVHHHTDPKVRAHVDLCMFALLLERWLEQQLRDQGQPMTARACMERLANCDLNRLSTPWGDTLSITEPTADQRAIVAALKMEDLLDRDAVSRRLNPA